MLTNVKNDVPVKNRLEGTRRPLPYKCYVRMQERLRAERRELLLFCEHPRTLTAGVQTHSENLLVDEASLRAAGVAHERIGRGGDYTAHEPGQCVIYPHVDLRARNLPMSPLFRALLSLTARCVREVWAIEATTREDAPGLYTAQGAKLCSIGLMFKSFFTSFGLALNVQNDLSTFAYINPCGRPRLPITNVVESGGDPARTGEFVARFAAGFNDLVAPL